MSIFETVKQEQRTAVRDAWVSGAPVTPMRSCNCIGPQDGAPLCPCQMVAQGIIVRDGRYVLPEQDLGPCRG